MMGGFKASSGSVVDLIMIAIGLLGVLMACSSAGDSVSSVGPSWLNTSAEHRNKSSTTPAVALVKLDAEQSIRTDVNATASRNNSEQLQQQSESSLSNVTLMSIVNSPSNVSTTAAPPGDDGPHQNTSDAVQQVRVLCWVMTSPSTHKSKAVHVKATWGRRCNKLLFVTEQRPANSKLLPAVVVSVRPGREHLTAKTMQAFDYIYKNHMKDADWFMKADDDTYVIVDNLRYFLSSEDPDQPVYFGQHFDYIVKPQGYTSGGAGYVLSREALRRFGTRRSKSRSGVQCSDDGGSEDVAIGKCLQSLGVRLGDSRDAMNRSRFHCFDPSYHLQGGYPGWYRVYDKYGARKGIDTISNYAISFHYIDPNTMYYLEFFLYHLRPYGFNIDTPSNLNRRPIQMSSVSRSIAAAADRDSDEWKAVKFLWLLLEFILLLLFIVCIFGRFNVSRMVSIVKWCLMRAKT